MKAELSQKQQLSSLVKELINEMGTIDAVARQIGVKHPTVISWRDCKALATGNSRARMLEWLGVKESTFTGFLNGEMGLKDFLLRRGEARNAASNITINKAIDALKPLINSASPEELIAGLYAWTAVQSEMTRSLEAKIRPAPSDREPATKTQQNLVALRDNVAKTRSAIPVNSNQNDQPLPGTFPAFVRNWMQQQNISQEEFESAIEQQGPDTHLSVQRVRQIQNGEIKPNLSELIAIIKALGLLDKMVELDMDISRLSRFYGIANAPDNDISQDFTYPANDSLD